MLTGNFSFISKCGIKILQQVANSEKVPQVIYSAGEDDTGARCLSVFGLRRKMCQTPH